MRIATIASAIATGFIVVGLFAVPAVANGTASLDHADVQADSPLSVVYAPASDTAPAPLPTTSIELNPFVAAWWLGGGVVLAGAAIAVGASVRRQSKLAD